MRKRRKQAWHVGDVFSVEQEDGFYCLGQVLDLPMPNVPSCAYYDIRHPHGSVPAEIKLPFDKVIAALSVTREQLDCGIWKVLANLPVVLDQQYWPNEPYREMDWVGAETYGAGIVTRLLDAYYGLGPWDIYKDPDYFDKMLFFGRKRPRNLIFKADVK